ncbi:MAG: hypothetical protein QXF23_05050 [Candidatus Bathyarchaeia archaeon]
MEDSLSSMGPSALNLQNNTLTLLYNAFMPPCKIYAAADLRITPRPAPDDQFFALLEDLIRSKGFDVDKELLKKAIMKPHRTIVTIEEMEKERRKLIRDTFIKLLRNEFFEGGDEYIGSK